MLSRLDIFVKDMGIVGKATRGAGLATPVAAAAEAVTNRLQTLFQDPGREPDMTPPQLVYGPLTDRFGRRSVLFVSLIFYSIAAVLCIFAPTFELLIAARAFMGASAGGSNTDVAPGTWGVDAFCTDRIDRIGSDFA